MEINHVINYFKNVVNRKNDNQSSVEISSFLKSQKAKFIKEDKQLEAKYIWCLEQVLPIQNSYIEAFEQLKKGNFYEAWCTLERCEIESDCLWPHFSKYYKEYKLDFIDKIVSQFQSLFPYNLFISPELLELEKKCNICDKIVSIRKPCGHEVGEIYNGEMCLRIVTKIEFLGTAFVESPLQKYSVLFLNDKETGKKTDHYNYNLLKYLMEKLQTPFDDWDMKWTTKEHPHSKFSSINKDEYCPCASGEEYGDCCLKKSGVLMKHCIFRIPSMITPEERIF